MSETKVTVESSGKGYFGLNIKTASGHTIISDLPEAKGGQDSGPVPYELLTAALASCSTLMAKFIAKKSNIPLQDIIVTVTHAKQGERDVFTRTVSFQGDLTSEQEKTLQQAVNDCALHKTLTQGADVKTNFSDLAEAA